MDGIGYTDSIVLYNRTVTGEMEEESFYSTRLDGVRIELTQKSTTKEKATDGEDSCLVKIPMKLCKKCLPPAMWTEQKGEQGYFSLRKQEKDFFVIAKKPLMGINVTPPTGKVDGSQYTNGFFDHMEREYGFCYRINSIAVHELIPRMEVGGR